MSSTIISKQCPRICSNADDADSSSLDNVIWKDQAKNLANQVAKVAETKGRGPKEPAFTVGEVAWNNMFQDEAVKIPDKNIMNWVKQMVT